jgi:hypothetical protein
LRPTLIAAIKPLPPIATQPFVVAASVTDSFDTKLNERLMKQRDALETDRDRAILGATSAASEGKQKFVDQVEQLKRSLAKKLAEDLCEGGEGQLGEVLRAEVPDARSSQWVKGAVGADIHTGCTTTKRAAYRSALVAGSRRI